MERFVFVPGALQHIAFALPTMMDAQQLRERLTSYSVPATDIGTLGAVRNILFQDNNGLLLEATWPGTEQ